MKTYLVTHRQHGYLNCLVTCGCPARAIDLVLASPTGRDVAEDYSDDPSFLGDRDNWTVTPVRMPEPGALVYLGSSDDMDHDTWATITGPEEDR